MKQHFKEFCNRELWAQHKVRSLINEAWAGIKDNSLVIKEDSEKNSLSDYRGAEGITFSALPPVLEAHLFC